MLQVDELATDALHIVIYVEKANAAPGLPPSISHAAGIEKQLPIMFLVIGNVTVSKVSQTQSQGCSTVS
jgi:hypothetical protein